VDSAAVNDKVIIMAQVAGGFGPKELWSTLGLGWQLTLDQ
jgi:hypothetical protein